MSDPKLDIETLDAQPPLLPCTAPDCPVHSNPAARKTTRARRFRRACAGFILLLVILLIHVNLHAIVRAVRRFAESRSGMYAPYTTNLDIIRCNEWSNYFDQSTGYSSRVEFDLPVASDLLLLSSRGASTGTVRFVSTEDAGDSINVQVSFKYHVSSMLDQVDVCLVGKDSTTTGVNIVAPSHWHDDRHHRSPMFDVVVRFPASADSALVVKSFLANLPQFAIVVDDIGEAVDFKKITLHTENAPITVKSLSTEAGLMATSYGPITGSFRTSNHLSLITANAAIKVKLALVNNNSSRVTDVKMHTSNAALKASVSLTTDEGTGGRFGVAAHTSVGSVDVDFPTAPVDSSLRLTTRTSLGNTVVALHPTFEGRFQAETSLHAPRVEQREHEDPAGRGRHREVDIITFRGGFVGGEVAWKPSEKNTTGAVEIRSSAANVVLKL